MLVVTQVDPQPAQARLVAGAVLHRQRRVVGMHHRRGQHRLYHRGNQRPQHVGAGRHPVAGRRALQFQTVAGEDAFQPVQRHVVAVLAGNDLGQEPGTRQALVDRLCRLGSGRDLALTVPAGVGGPHVFDDEQGSRLVVELLADLGADALALVPALWTQALRYGHVMLDAPPR